MDNYKLPTEWVDRIFQRLEEIYGCKWKIEIQGKESLYREIWCTGLFGLTKEQVKKALAICEIFKHADIPNHIEFYHAAKGLPYNRRPIRKPLDIGTRSLKVAEKHLSDIRRTLKSNRL